MYKLSVLITPRELEPSGPQLSGSMDEVSGDAHGPVQPHMTQCTGWCHPVHRTPHKSGNLASMEQLQL